MVIYGNILRMKKTTLYLKEEQVRKLEAISSKTGAPVAELIRRAIDAYTKKEK
jgi:predicted DNA-binding protein